MGEQPLRFTHRRVEGAQVERVIMPGASYRLVDLTGARFHNVYLQGARMTGVVLEDAVIDGDIGGLVINGVEVAPLVEAELDRRHPDRALMRPTDAAGYAAAWRRLEQLWDRTVERALALEERVPGALDERVDGEFSFLETLRHLVFGIDAWVLRVYLGEPAPYHPLGVTHEEEDDNHEIGLDRGARPSTPEVLAAFDDRWHRVARVYADLADEDLTGLTEPVDAPGYPPPHAYPVDRVLRAVISEAWEHRLFAERDLAVVEKRAVDSLRQRTVDGLRRRATDG